MKVQVNGQWLSERALALILDAARAAGIPADLVKVIQGSWSNGSKSAGTHSGGGAADLSVAKLTREQQIAFIYQLRRRHVAAWLRTPEFGWTAKMGGPHIHLIVRDEPFLSWGAKAQVLAYKLKRNGLANRKKDPHPQPKSFPFIMPRDVDIKQLYWGASNGHVRALQRALGIAEDSYYGPATDRAVRDHQAASGLSPVDAPGKSFVGPKQAKILGLGPA